MNLVTFGIAPSQKGFNMIFSNGSPRKLRLALMASVCAGGLMTAPQAAAQDASSIAPRGEGFVTGVSPEAHRNGGFVTATAPEAHRGGGFVTAVTPEAHGGGHVAAVAPEPFRFGPTIIPAPEPQILIADPGTPTTARDPVNINGIGQMFINNGGGSIGLCTGTLINPRTVIFAAHCANSRPATAYGAGSGGTPMAFGFETNTRANAPGQPDELLLWFTGARAGQTNVAQALYNVNHLAYNPFSLEPAARSFLYGDVAIATLDTPAANIPTWALLFSPLPVPATATAAGTGYNVGLAGYGGNGTGTSGTVGGIDFRRRAAENILGAFTDLQSFEQFLFGGAPNGLTQNLYLIDFDDPRRNLTGESPFDFNAFRDPARRAANGTPTEGGTAGGDSGGPLILQNFSKQLVIGVLSGGYTRFFGGQPANSYGTVSFYQPLHLYWDWIAANNPYVYASAAAGNGQWTDAARWVTTLDPAYNILSGGQPVNGLPTLVGLQKNGTTGDFGQACFEQGTGGVNECVNLANGQLSTVPPSNGGVTVDGDGIVTTITGDRVRGDLAFSAERAPHADAVSLNVPVATIANGLPGATNFVPNNIDPVRLTGVKGRYFDVTLTAAGTTTLSGANVVIDRLTIGTAVAGLAIASGASLTTLINTTQFAGINTVDGTLTSVGDYSLLGGALLGSGRINAPFLTSVMGQIAPGTQTGIGTLTVGGNVILASGSGLFINIGAAGTSDLLAVVANGTSTGAANVGGAVNFSTVAGYRPTFGNSFTFLTATGGVTGTFNAPAAFSAILSPNLTYSANAVSMNIIAGLYRNVIAAGAPIQSAFAQLLDQNRGNYAALSGLFGELDLLSVAGVRSNLDALAPNHIPIQNDLGYASTEVLSSFIRDRIGRVTGGDMGGTVATYGRPLQLASMALNTQADGSEVRSDAGTAMRVDDDQVADDVSVFLAGGYIDGRGSGLPFATPGGRSDFDGFYIAGGAEKSFEDGSFLGFAGGYSDLEGAARNSFASATGRLIQGSLYGAKTLAPTFSLDVQVSAGQLQSTTARIVPVGPLVETLAARDNAFTFSAEAGLAYQAGSDMIAFTPRVAVRWGQINFTPTAEVGGTAALRYDLGQFKSLQARAGFGAKVRTGTIRPFVNANYVHEFEDRPLAFGANFRSGVGPDALFALPGTDRDWFEVGGGLTVGGDKFNASIAGETQVGRSDMRTLSVRGTLLYRF